jgi:hypothetical protein
MLYNECIARLQKKGVTPIPIGVLRDDMIVLQWDVVKAKPKSAPATSFQLLFFEDHVKLEVGNRRNQIFWPFKTFLYADPKFPTNLFRNLG